ncbi:MAG: DUF126 domain-containing protein [Actinomycetota bacterium]|nr:DUF126 domain-containing protein [Actinomycetota bacterium]
MKGRVLVDGAAAGSVLATDTTLSLWGGLDAQTGTIIDRHHPLAGEVITGRILVLPAGRGSSAASAMLLEGIVSDKGPAALLLAGVDEVLAIGAIVAAELFSKPIPVLELDAQTFAAASEAAYARIETGGRISLIGERSNGGRNERRYGKEGGIAGLQQYTTPNIS